MNLEQACQITRRGDDFFSTVDPSWYQGKGAYGGLAAAWALSAMGSFTEHNPRSLTMHLVAPLTTKEVVIAVQPAAQTLRTSHYRFTLKGDEGQLLAFGSGSFASPRSTAIDNVVAMPCAPDSYEDSVQWPYIEKMMPAFLQHLNVRQASGTMMGGDEGTYSVWLQGKVQAPHQAATIAALLDAGAPSVFARCSTPRLMASMVIHQQFHGPFTNDRAPLLLYCHEERTFEGYCDEVNLMFNQNGLLLGSSRQMVALLR